MAQLMQAQPKMKMLVNDPTQAVNEGNLGLALCHTSIVKVEGHRIIMRRDHQQMKGKVKLLSGGGGGHFPSQAGFVGPGMLTAAVSGEVFRAPSSTSILLAIREIGYGHPEGVLLIISNYVGDRINFGLAMERAHRDNIKIRLLVVADDCAVLNPPETVGRRGIAGCTFVVKVAGAMAEEGRKLEDIYNACRSPCFSEMSTIGFAMTSPTIPGSLTSYRVPDDEIAFGVGVHGNEVGVRSLPLGYTAGEIVHVMLEHMSNTTKSLSTDEEVAVLINNLGGACKMEEQVFAMETIKQLTARGIKIRRVFAGRFTTSLDTCGMSITVLNLKAPIDVVKYLDAETKVPGWPHTLTAGRVGVITDNEYTLPVFYAGREFPENEAMSGEEQGPRLSNRNADSFHQVIRMAAEAVMASSNAINSPEAEAGDSDCSLNVRKGAEEILHALNSREINVNRPYATLQQLCSLCERSMTGTSGPLYSILFTAGSSALRGMPEDMPADSRAWICALSSANEALQKYGMGRQGDRTMLDPLIAAEMAGKEAIEGGELDGKRIAELMAAAAEEATSATVRMPAYFGKLGYAFKQMPDPGASCVSVWLRAISEALKLVS